LSYAPFDRTAFMCGEGNLENCNAGRTVGVMRP